MSEVLELHLQFIIGMQAILLSLSQQCLQFQTFPGRTLLVKCGQQYAQRLLIRILCVSHALGFLSKPGSPSRSFLKDKGVWCSQPRNKCALHRLWPRPASFFSHMSAPQNTTLHLTCASPFPGQDASMDALHSLEDALDDCNNPERIAVQWRPRPQRFAVR